VAELLYLYYGALLATVICASAISCWLWLRSSASASFRPLAGFGVAMAVWCAGHLLIQFSGPLNQLGLAMIMAGPLIPTCFLHFALLFVHRPDTLPPSLSRLYQNMPFWYGAAALVSVCGWFFGQQQVQQWNEFSGYVLLNPAGWANVLYTAWVSAVAHTVLLWGGRHSSSIKKRSIGAMFKSSGLGFVLAAGFVIPSLGLDLFPYPMLLLPLYTMLMLYGVVRYQMQEANRWAHTIIIALVMLAGLSVATFVLSHLDQIILFRGLVEIPWWQLAGFSLVLVCLAWLFNRLGHSVADHLIYPGSRISDVTFEFWLQKLESCRGWEQLRHQSASLISERVGQPVSVLFGSDLNGRGPVIRCLQQEGEWSYLLENWQDMTPTLRHSGEMFAALLASRCSLLERSLQLAEEEKRRLAEQHLVELGGLSAAVAHELRNPLNIISMASAQCDKATKQYIQTQLKRADHLIDDLLSYSGNLMLNRQSLALLPAINGVVSYIEENEKLKVDIAVPDGFQLYSDPHRLQQVLVNLLENAAAFVRNLPEPRIRVDVRHDSGMTVLRISNNGPEIPDDLKDQLFLPFITRRAGGSGLGLAIVRRIMEAHDGSIRLVDDDEWPVTFECSFPGLTAE